MHILIIIPTYNEKENIIKIIDEIKKNIENTDYSILIVDDSSNDGTLDEIEKIKNDNIHVLVRPCKMGLASAYIDGIRYGIDKGFDYFISMDADFSHNPIYLPTMIKKLKANDVVIGSRNIKGGKVVGWGPVRNIISKGGSLYSNIVLGCPIRDLTGGFNGWSKAIIEKIGLENIISKGYCFQIEMKYRAFLNKAKIVEFPIVFEDRKFGKSKMSKQIFIEAFINILKLRLRLVDKH